jgi:hypothetical protein
MWQQHLDDAAGDPAGTGGTGGTAVIVAGRDAGSGNRAGRDDGTAAGCWLHPGNRERQVLRAR